MILQRLAIAVRRQEWFTVLLEVLIVVVGILIALQVENWNEAQGTERRSGLTVKFRIFYGDACLSCRFRRSAPAT